MKKKSELNHPQLKSLTIHFKVNEETTKKQKIINKKGVKCGVKLTRKTECSPQSLSLLSSCDMKLH